jgi:hypothetical protein
MHGAKPSTLPGINNDKLGDPPYLAMNPANRSPRPYSPLVETPDLFIRFRDIALNAEAILSFANKHGWIGATGQVIAANQTLTPAVGISKWYEEIQAMIVAHHLWDCVKANDRATLREYFSWNHRVFNVCLEIGIDQRMILDKTDPDVKQSRIQRPLLRRPYTQWLLRPQDVDPLREMGWSDGDVIGPARLAIMTFVNSRLETLCRPRLYLDKHRGFAGHVTPTNLLGCIWLQFYLSLIGQLKLRRCAVCGFEMDVTESRSTRRMHAKCSKRERMRKWRANPRSNAGGNVQIGSE